MKKLRINYLATITLASMLVLQPTLLHANDDAKSAQGSAVELSKSRLIEEVVVTARRTDESLQEVPIAISVLDADSLQRGGIATTTDLATSVPGLTGGSFYSSVRTTFTIRGQGEAYGGSLPGVLAYFAEVPNFSSAIYDLSSVQVLKGPQGTLFGKNTTGGAVLFTPVKPSFEFGGFLNFRKADNNGRDIDFALNLPISEGLLAARIAGQILKTDGYIADIFDDQSLNDVNRSSFRLSLLFTPTEALENLTLAQNYKVDQLGPAYIFDAYVDEPTVPYYLELAEYGEKQRARGPRIAENDVDNVEYAEGYGVFNNTSWTISEDWILKNIASYRTEEGYTSADLDGSPFLIASSLQAPDEQSPQITWTEELQVQMSRDNIQFVAGVYFDATTQEQTNIEVVLGAPGSTSAQPVSYNYYLRTRNSRSSSQAVFTQFVFNDFLVEDLRVTAGVRYTSDKRKSTNSQSLGVNAINAGAVSKLLGIGPISGLAIVEIPTLEPTTFRLDSGATTWNLSLDYKVDESKMIYGSVRKGYKAGGFNITGDSSRVLYGPEYVTDFEVGIKSEFPVGDMQVRLNADVFYDDYTDIQRNLYLDAVPPAQVVSNAAGATISGVDLDFLFAVSADFRVSLQYTYLRPEYSNFYDEVLGDLSNSTFPSTPEHQFTISPQYSFILPDKLGLLSASLSYFWQAKQSLWIPNTPNGNDTNDQAVAGSNGNAFKRIGARLDWERVLGSELTVSIYGKNLSDEEYQVGALNTMTVDIVGVGSKLYGPPRSYGMEVNYKF